MAKDTEKKSKSFTIGNAKGKEVKSRAELLGGIVKDFQKSSGCKNIFADARDDPRLIVPRISTSLYGLDVATGGGLPLGRVTGIYGDPKGGKTTLLLRAVADYQRRCASCNRVANLVPGIIQLPNLETGEVEDRETLVISECECGNPVDVIVLWIDSEGVWDPIWASKMGVLGEKVILLRSSFGEQGYDSVISFSSTGAVNLFVIDSLANMTPADELASGMQEQSQGLAARINNKFLRKLVSMLNLGFQHGKQFTVFTVNQYREKIGVMFGSNRVLTGGKGQLFTTSLEIEMAPGTVTISDDDEPVFGEFRWTVKKNKVGVQGGKGSFKQWMCNTDLFSIGDIQEHEYVIAKAVSLGMISHPNAQIYEYAGSKFRGELQMVKYFAENPDEYVNLKARMLAAKLRVQLPVVEVVMTPGSDSETE